ncbi:Hypothetical protein POVR2_LOCUS168 [uncultured virus]|nr:Hypothetical protein POVR2_LOCUS168 [uncultured virus]
MIMYNDYEIYLSQAPDDIDEQEESLMAAVNSCNVEILQLLLASDKIDNCDSKMAEAMLVYGVQSSKTMLLAAAKYGLADMLELLLQGSTLSSVGYRSHRNEAVVLTIIGSHIAAYNVLYKFEVDKSDLAGIACRGSSLEMINVLLDSKTIEMQLSIPLGLRVAKNLQR